jgi:hypothetical protein
MAGPRCSPVLAFFDQAGDQNNRPELLSNRLAMSVSHRKTRDSTLIRDIRSDSGSPMTREEVTGGKAILPQPHLLWHDAPRTLTVQFRFV